MTTLVNFAPSPLAPFQFQATLDGVAHNVIVTWNVFGRRWYVNVYQQDGTRVVSLPNIGSPPGKGISLVAGYFKSTLVFRQATRQFEIAP